MDALFYPEPGNGIEAEYLLPVLKTPRSVRGLLTQPDGVAFCCSRSESELERLHHSGTLRWIRRFERETNEKGHPLPEVLEFSGHHWYELEAATLADLVASMNYGNRLFIARMAETGFVNQRLIRFTQKEGTDVDPGHALLNSVVWLFFIEALGFPRGLGALDLNTTKLRHSLRMQDPSQVSGPSRTAILDAFRPLLNRDPVDLPIELGLPERERFDRVVLRAFGVEECYGPIKAAALELHEIRTAVAR